MNNSSWVYVFKNRNAPIRPILEREINREIGGVKMRVIDCAIVRIHTAYLAIEIVDSRTMQRAVAAEVCFLEYRSTETYNFGFKRVDERALPMARHAPRHILEKLTPTDDDNAKIWRKSCWANVAKGERLARIRTGMVVTHPTGVKCSDGVMRNRFRLIRKGLFRAMDDGAVVKIDPSTITEMNIEHGERKRRTA